MAVHRLENGGGRRTPYAGLNTQTTPPRRRTTPSLPRGVVDLDAWWWRPWPGWWGGMELRCWTVAERSRRAA
jgi:hypothetical protein